MLIKDVNCIKEKQSFLLLYIINYINHINYISNNALGNKISIIIITIIVVVVVVVYDGPS